MNNNTKQEISQMERKSLERRFVDTIDDDESNRYPTYKPFVNTFGDFEGLFLSVLHGLCRRSYWVSYTYEEWHKIFFSKKSPQAIQKAILKLEKAGLIESEQPNGLDRKKNYRLVEWAVMKAIVESEGKKK